MADGTPAASALDRISAELRTFGASDEDTRRLLAAVEATLKLADELEHLGTVPPSGKEDEAAALGIRWVAAKLRAAITTALTGKEADDGG